MNDAMACKCVESNKKQKTPSEIYMSVAQAFSGLCIKKNDEFIKFKKVMSKECQLYFKKFIDINKNSNSDNKTSMDQNNPHRVSNYKGFMNMIGLMYCYNLFPKEIICMCFDQIVKLILDSDLPQEECDNYYSGYERLMNRVLCIFEVDNVSKNMLEEFNGIKNYITDFNNKIIEACQDSSVKSSSKSKPLRMFSSMTHKKNIVRFETLSNKYKNIEKEYKIKK
jgi:hypothetical protein